MRVSAFAPVRRVDLSDATPGGIHNRITGPYPCYEQFHMSIEIMQCGLILGTSVLVTCFNQSKYNFLFPSTLATCRHKNLLAHFLGVNS